jgi:hypothetical protein
MSSLTAMTAGPYVEVMGGGVIAFFAAALWLRFHS